MVAHQGDLFIAAALFLPGLDQRTVVEVDIQVVVVAAQDLHFEDLTGKEAEEGFLQSLQLHDILKLNR